MGYHIGKPLPYPTTLPPGHWENRWGRECTRLDRGLCERKTQKILKTLLCKIQVSLIFFKKKVLSRHCKRSEPNFFDIFSLQMQFSLIFLKEHFWVHVIIFKYP